jgi:hypothetical protein
MDTRPFLVTAVHTLGLAAAALTWCLCACVCLGAMTVFGLLIIAHWFIGLQRLTATALILREMWTILASPAAHGLCETLAALSESWHRLH